MDSQNLRFSKNPILFWYVSMPEFIWFVVEGESKRLFHMFSIPELFRTLFAPWKRDEISTANMALSDKFQIWTGNLAGRFVAFIIRSLTILVGILVLAGYFLLGMLTIAAVILLPFIVITLLIFGVR